MRNAKTNRHKVHVLPENESHNEIHVKIFFAHIPPFMSVVRQGDGPAK